MSAIQSTANVLAPPVASHNLVYSITKSEMDQLLKRGDGTEITLRMAEQAPIRAAMRGEYEDVEHLNPGATKYSSGTMALQKMDVLSVHNSGSQSLAVSASKSVLDETGKTIDYLYGNTSSRVLTSNAKQISFVATPGVQQTAIPIYLNPKRDETPKMFHTLQPFTMHNLEQHAQITTNNFTQEKTWNVPCNSVIVDFATAAWESVNATSKLPNVGSSLLIPDELMQKTVIPNMRETYAGVADCTVDPSTMSFKVRALNSGERLLPCDLSIVASYTGQMLSNFGRVAKPDTPANLVHTVSLLPSIIYPQAMMSLSQASNGLASVIAAHSTATKK